jgi:DNA repair protein RadA/Sms
MATKSKSFIYRCVNCGHTEPKWLGRCPECGQWNTLRESAQTQGLSEKAGETFPLPIVSIDPTQGARVSTGFSEVDRVLGGGLLRGSVTLIGGEPGIGKSTLLLQLCSRAETKGRILYVSGEESPAQIRMRADRLGTLRDTLEVFCACDLGLVRTTLDALKPSIAVIDSIQTLAADEAGSIPGTANQIKYCVQELSAWAKAHDSALILVAHVTKEGYISGPKTAEHLVDTVLSFEQGDGDMRVLRASKNRFGSAEEVGLFRMNETGLEEVADPTGLFLVRRGAGALPAGVAVALVDEGSRVLLVEIQALTVSAKAGLTRVYSERIEAGRVSRIAAILEKHTGLRFSDQDIYVNVAGGMRLTEPGIDFALACALFSARSDMALPANTAFAGELSLAGELRPVRQMKRRAKTAAILGFTQLFGPTEPAGDAGDVKSKRTGSDLHEAGWAQETNITSALKTLFKK